MTSQAAAGWVYVLIVIGLCGVAGWGAIRLLWRGSLEKAALGLLLLLASVVLPFFLAYLRPVGTVAAVVGAVVAGVQLFGGVGWRSRLGFLGLIAFMIIEPPVSAYLGNLQEAERLDRCLGEVAIKTIEADRSPAGYYPNDFFTVYRDADYHQSPSCPMFMVTNWLYRADQQEYTVGYWRDWGVGTHVCQHSSGQSGWTCGLNRWGPFSPVKSPRR